MVVIRVLVALFLSICVAVHVYGLITRFNNESIPSHIIHLLSYSLCLFTFLRPVKYRLALYLLGTVYPVWYHAACFFTQLSQLHKFNSICFQVIVILPLAALLLWQGQTRQQ